MRYRRQSETGDYVFGQGASEFLIDVPEAVAQAVKTRLNLIRGEWYLDADEGTPWKTQILGEGTLDTYDLAIREVILDTPGVFRIDSYASVLDTSTRELTVAAVITTIYGQTILNAVI